MGCCAAPKPPRYRLIVNADDFGRTAEVNQCIAAAHRGGIVTAATLTGNGAAFDQAVELAKATPTLDVGCHLVLIQGESLREHGRALPATLRELVVALGLRRIDPYEEMVAQVRRIARAGIRPTHLDTRQHTHLLPPVLDAVVRIAHEFRIPWVRRPFDYAVDPAASVTAGALAMGMRATGPMLARALSGLRSTDHFAGIQMAGEMDERRLTRTLEHLPTGLTELMWRPEREDAETRALTSGAVREVIARREIALVNYRGW